MGIPPISTKTCPVRNRDRQQSTQLPKSYKQHLKNIITKQISLHILYMQKLRIWDGVCERRSVVTLTWGLYKCNIKKFYKSEFRYSFLKDPWWKPSLCFRGWAGLFLLEHAAQDTVTFQLGLPFQTRQEVLRSDCLEYETDVILHILKHLLVVVSL